MTICQKAADKASKRKTFDVKAARLGGTEHAQLAKKSDVTAKKYEKKAKKKGDWKAKSEAFRAAMRAAKDPNSAPVEAYVDPDQVQCEHCNRTFSSGAAERHIPRCKESAMKNSLRLGNANKAKSKGKAKYDPRAALKAKGKKK